MEPTADGGGTVGAGDPGTGRRPDQTDRGRAEPGGGEHSAPGEGESATGKAPPPHNYTPPPTHTTLHSLILTPISPYTCTNTYQCRFYFLKKPT